MKNFCPTPFQNIEIYKHDTFSCCMDWNFRYGLGNIFEQNFEDIWNSQKAIDFRKKILNDDYSLCDAKKCPFARHKSFEPLMIDIADCKPVMEISPFFVKLEYDTECNIACNICRDKIIKNSNEEEKILDKYIDDIFIPLLKNTKIVTLSGSGDAFGSRHSRKLIQKISKTYPEIKFDFLTNGILCDEKMLEKFNLKSKIFKMRISVNAATKETYGKVVKNGEKLFDKLVKNLEMIGKLQEKNLFEYYIQMVVTSDNYKEMPEFVDFARKFHAEPTLWEYRPQNCFNSSQNIYEKEIVSPKHPQHKDFLNILKDERLNLPNTRISPLLYDLRNSYSSHSSL